MEELNQNQVAQGATTETPVASATQPVSSEASAAQPAPAAQTVLPQEEPTASEKTVAAVGYISFLCLLPIILRRDSEYCQFHGKQALLVCIILFALRFFFIIPILGYVFTVLEIVAILVMMYLAYSGNWFRIPGIANIADKLALSKEDEEMLKGNAEANKQ